MLDSKLTEQCIGLLSLLAILEDNWHATELSSVSCSLALAPGLLADLDLLVGDAFVCEEHVERTRSAISTWEILDLHSLIVALLWPFERSYWSSGTEIFS